MPATLAAFVAVLSMVPPLAILPILFITLGLGELAKVTLIFHRHRPLPHPRPAFRVAELPAEQLIKAQTLGASTWQIASRGAAAGAAALICGLRLSLGPAWLFLIAAEAIAVHRGPGLPHLPGPPLPRHGRDPALRGLDHAARLPHGPALAAASRAPVPLGRAA